MIPLKLADEAFEDLKALPSERLQRVALDWMAVLRHEPHRGPRLEWRRSGDLRRARKLYFDEEDQPRRTNFIAPEPRPGGPRYRIVYELLPKPERPALIRVIAIGLKIDAEGGEGVYERAARRLDE